MARGAYLAALGVTPWRQRRELVAGAQSRLSPTSVMPVAPVSPMPPVALADIPAPVPGASDTWELLEPQVATCTRCALHASRNCTVFGVGDRNARWLFVGEAPGEEEDRRGEPFVGRAGRLLDSMLQAIGLSRQQVYIANILKCRPPGNRNPQPQEVAQCMPYLERQIALLRPAIMVAVGSVAAQNLLGTDAPVGRLRGQVHAFGAAGTPLVVTYHP